MKHTPGPWTFRKTGYTVSGGKEINQTYTINRKGDDGFYDKSIANIESEKEVGNPLHGCFFPNEEAQANAELIAQAPDILKERDELKTAKEKLLKELQDTKLEWGKSIQEVIDLKKALTFYYNETVSPYRINSKSDKNFRANAQAAAKLIGADGVSKIEI